MHRCGAGVAIFEWSAVVRFLCIRRCLHLLQTCQAYAADGGRVVVVMTQREKIGMETLFRRIIPPHKRCGCNFVFRQVASCATNKSAQCPNQALAALLTVWYHLAGLPLGAFRSEDGGSVQCSRHCDCL